MCDGDILFTDVDQYCPPGTLNCEILPGFAYDPEQTPYRPDGTIDTTDQIDRIWAGVSFNPGTEQQCNFSNRTFNAVSDHYGVIGIPGNSIPTEAEVVNVLAGEGCLDVALGDEFQILESGFTTVAAKNIVWSHVLGQVVSPGEHPAFSEAVSPYVTTRGRFRHLAGQANCQSHWDLFPNQFNVGRCDSMRMSSLFCDPVWPGFSVCGSIWRHSRYADMCITPTEMSIDTPVWTIEVPVIADFSPSATPCGGTPPKPKNAGTDFRVVGTQKIAIYDLDIASAAIPTPTHCGGRPLSDPWVPPPFWMGSPIERGINQVLYPHTIEPWAFQQGPCNVVRTRVLCENDFIAAANTINGPRPRLILQ